MRVSAWMALGIVAGLTGHAAYGSDPAPALANEPASVAEKTAVTVRGWDLGKKDKIEGGAPVEGERAQSEPDEAARTTTAAGERRADPDDQGRVKVKLPAEQPDVSNAD